MILIRLAHLFRSLANRLDPPDSTDQVQGVLVQRWHATVPHNRMADAIEFFHRKATRGSE